MIKINWDWPRTTKNDFYPWYIVLKNITLLPLVFVGGFIVITGDVIRFLGGIILYLYICLAFNLKHANNWWEREFGN